MLAEAGDYNDKIYELMIMNMPGSWIHEYENEFIMSSWIWICKSLKGHEHESEKAMISWIWPEIFMNPIKNAMNAMNLQLWELSNFSFQIFTFFLTYFS